jgi:hypothetical protein
MGLLDSATTAIGATNRVVGNIGQATSSISAVTQSAALIRSSAINGLTNTGSGVVGQLAGVANAAAGIAAGVQGAIAGAAGLAGAAAGVAGALGATGLAGALGGFAASLGGATAAGGAGAAVPSNPLHKYASYTYMFGLYALTDGEVNGGARNPYAGIPIIQMPNGPTIGATTYMDNVKISGTIGLDKQAGNSNALSLSFKVIEPYSMGKFWETLQTAALMAGHKNYVDAPYMLAIIFKGHFNADEQFQKVPKTDKYIHMKIRDVTMRVTARGSEYDIEAYPWNEQGMSSSFSEIKTDAMISCNSPTGPYTVADLLSNADKSLKKIINDKLKDDKDRKKNVTYAHEIDIVFPTYPYTSNDMGNPIGLSKLGLDVYNKGDTPFSKDNATYDPATGIYKRGDIQIDTKNANFKFAQGSTVQDIINQVILTSDYGKKALEEANQTPDGKVIWWRIETHLHNISSEDPKTGQKAKKVIFRVVPYEVDATVFTAPNTGSKGAASMAISRDFNYIYTGKNHDILDFAIEYKVGFYRAFNADGGKNSEDKTLAPASGGAADSPSGAAVEEPEPTGGSGGPEAARRDKVGSSTSKFGGGTGFDDASTTAARQFHDLATRGYDMLNLNLKILGDPYFLGDSGHGNFTIPSEGSGINSAGSVDWQTGEVFVRVTFRTPEDANTDTGKYDFGNTQTVREFTGIYKVLQVENEFSKGKFTQTLGLTKQTVTEGGGGNFPAKEPEVKDLGPNYGP